MSRLSKGDFLGPYEIKDLLGSGGMGDVYLAREETLDRLVAIKMISMENDDHAENSQRFLAEGRALAKLDHPNIVNVHSVGELDGLPYLVMEYVPGHPLNWCLDRGLITFADYLPIFKQICEGIADAHKNAIIHRDLKPANIIVMPNGRVKIIDFGIAKIYASSENHKTTTGIVMGTVDYIAPEIACGRPPSIQTDIYGLGVILFELLVGQPPFVSQNTLKTLERIKSEPPTIPPDIRALIPDQLAAFVMKLLNKDLMQRYQNANDVLRDLEKIRFDSIPQELKVARPNALDILNEDEVRLNLKKLGYMTREISLLVNLASQIQTQIDDSSDVSIKSGHTTKEIDTKNPTLVIGPAAVDRACSRFEQIKSGFTARPGFGASRSAPPPPPGIGTDPDTDVISLRIDDETEKIHLPKRRFRLPLRYMVAGFGAFACIALGVNVYLLMNMKQTPRPAYDPVPREPAQIVDGPPKTEVVVATTARKTNLDPDVEARLIEKGREMANVSLAIPKLAVGDEWAYMDVSDPTKAEYTWKVTSVYGDVVTYENSKGGQNVGTHGFTGWFSSFDKDPLLGTGGQSGAFEANALFPLRHLNEMNFEAMGKHNGESTGWRFRITCTSYANGAPSEKFSTPAGEFRVHMIVCQDKDAGYQDLFYYAPEVGRFIFWHGSRPGQADKTLILKTYKRAARP